MLLADLDTGRVITAYNDHALLPPASLTKMLTGLVAVNWLPANATVPVSRTAAGVSPDKVGMKAGQRWPLGTTLHALLIVSANDAAYALAERVSGSIGAFGHTMSAAAAQLGMSDAPVLRDPAGLDGSEGYDGGNLMSAWDIAIAARDLLWNPTLRAIVGTRVYWFTSPSKVVNKLVNFNEAFLNSYPGAIGVKTGFTDRAGACVAEAAFRGGRLMLAVVMNGSNAEATAAALLNKGFKTPVADEHGPLLPTARQPSPKPAAAKPAPRTARPVADAPVNEAAPKTTNHAGLLSGPTDIAAVALLVLIMTTAALAYRSQRRRPVFARSHARRRRR